MTPTPIRAATSAASPAVTIARRAGPRKRLIGPLETMIVLRASRRRAVSATGEAPAVPTGNLAKAIDHAEAIDRGRTRRPLVIGRVARVTARPPGHRGKTVGRTRGAGTVVEPRPSDPATT
jgi:hypothetical protein